MSLFRPAAARRAALKIAAAGVLLVTCSSCATFDTRNMDVPLPETRPVQKVTSYTQALRNLGLMSEIYDTGPLRIQSNQIGDNTGTSGSTGGEIPRDITEIMKSVLNSIGGNVIFIPFDPNFIQHQMVTGYSNFHNKVIPDVVISGGITEFDRGLVTRGNNTDVGVELEIDEAPSFFPSKKIGLDYAEGGKTGLARITLDFNLLDFQTMTGIPRMNTVNSMEVTKALAEKEFAITLFGPTFGRKGSLKKVQGRHAAVRLLVEMSMIQMVGKHLALPYWRLLGEDAQPDEVVISTLKKNYYRMNDATRIYMAQQWLYLMGFEVVPTGNLDDATLASLRQRKPSFAPENGGIDVETFCDLYFSVPIDEKTLGRRVALSAWLQQQQQQQAQAETQPAPQPVEPAATRQREPAAAAQEPPGASAGEEKKAKAANAAPAQPAAPIPSGARVGRMLNDHEW